MEIDASRCGKSGKRETPGVLSRRLLLTGGPVPARCRTLGSPSENLLELARE